MRGTTLAVMAEPEYRAWASRPAVRVAPVTGSRLVTELADAPDGVSPPAIISPVAPGSTTSRDTPAGSW